MLAHLRNGDTYTRLVEGFAVGVATVYRYVREAMDLLTAETITYTGRRTMNLRRQMPRHASPGCGRSVSARRWRHDHYG